MLEEYCGWTRDVAWGNAPSWAAVGVAAVVGAFTIVNVRTARKSYVDGRWEKKVAQARKVYAHGSHRVRISTGQQLSQADAAHFEGLRDAAGRELVGSYEFDEAIGVEYFPALADAVFIEVTVSNASEELISEATVVFKGGAFGDGVCVAPERGGILLPGTEKKVHVAQPLDGAKADAEFYYVLEFVDSAGLRWRREGQKPIEEVPSSARA